MWTPAPIARSMIGLSRSGAILSSRSNGVTRMPEIPGSACRKLGFGFGMDFLSALLARPALRRGEVGRGENAALITLPDLGQRVLLRQNFGRVVLRILRGLVAEALATGRGPIAARVVRHAPAHDEPDLRG